MDQPEQSGGEISTRVLACLLHYLMDQHGEGVVDELAAAAEVPAELLTKRGAWLSLEQLETILVAARDRLESDREFEEACCYRFGELQAPPKLLAGAMVPATSYKLATRMSSLVTTIGGFSYQRLGPGHVALTYRSDKPESTKLVCLTRKATMVMGPTLWNLPRAQVTERRCLVAGDAACEYDIRYLESRRGLPALAGLALGAALATGLVALGQLTLLGAAATTLLGAVLGWAFELARIVKANIRTSRAINEEFLRIALEEAQTRQEIAGLEQREREWSRVMEEQVQERSAALGQLSAQLDAKRTDRTTALRSFTHDLRNPLAVVRATSSMLHQSPDLAERSAAALDDVDDAVARMDSLLDELMRTTAAGNGMVPLRSRELAVAELGDTFRRRVRALVYGRPIRVFVTTTRQAPETILVDPLLLDRVVDNLLTNAAKYTERGRIDVELDGSDEFLSIKVADTGRGIGEEDIARAFHPEGIPPEGRAASGYGVGLSVVVQLLDQIGGRLEVMSHPGEGTTFWAHIPHTPDQGADRPAASGGDPGRGVPLVSEPRELIDRVVTIRKAEGGSE